MEPPSDASVPAGHVVVVGGGIAGLAAAHRLVAAGVRVTLLEATDRLGGKLLPGEIEGVPVDLGAESMLARRPEAVDLARAVGLADRLQPPATSVRLPVDTRRAASDAQGPCDGCPGRRRRRSPGFSPPEGLARIAQERDLAPAEVGDDVAVGAYVADRLGREVVDRLVEPLLGGVYAGDAYRISMRAAVPQLFEAARTHASLLEGVQDVQRQVAARQRSGPVFMGIAGGVGTLPDAVADAVRAAGGEILTETPVLGLNRGTDGWQVRTDQRVVTADAVVLAAPAWAASALLAAESPAASAELGRIEYASMALVTLAFRRRDLSLPEGSGFLVPPVDGHTIKASTFSSQKWGWVDEGSDDLFVLRTSVGRYGDEEHLHRDDSELVAVSLRDLGEATGLAARPVATEVTRWIGGLPQYPVGHLTRVARIRDEVAELPGLRVCGAAYDGVGIPACIADGQRAADEILATPHPGAGHRRRARENSPMSAPEKIPNAGKKAKDLNEVIRYTLWSVFKLRDVLPSDTDRSAYAEEVQELFDQLAAKDVTVRGTYDLSGLRADADLMIWWHAETADELQDAYNLFRRTRLGRALEPVWSNMALHRPAEFNKSHIPAFLADETPRNYVSRLPLRALLRLVPAARRGPPQDARRPRQDGPRLPRRARQHRGVVLARRLRMAARLRGGRAVPHRRPDASSACLRGPHARPRGGPVLHGPPQVGRRPRGGTRLRTRSTMKAGPAACGPGLIDPEDQTACGSFGCAARRSSDTGSGSGCGAHDARRTGVSPRSR